MNNEKRFSNITVRLDEGMISRLERLEEITKLGRSEITRQALDGILRYFEEEGTITFPVEVISRKDLASTAEAIARHIVESEHEKLAPQIVPELSGLAKKAVADFHRRREEQRTMLTDLERSEGIDPSAE
jgi:hypothetical protein